MEILDKESREFIEQVSQRQEASATHPWSYDHALMFGVLMIVFGLLVFGMMGWLVHKKMNATAILKICALPLIIVSAVYLIVVGYTETQIAPVLSLLSAIAGYLLGRQDSGDDGGKGTGDGGNG